MRTVRYLSFACRRFRLEGLGFNPRHCLSSDFSLFVRLSSAMQPVVYSVLFATLCALVTGTLSLFRPVKPPPKARTWRVAQIPRSITEDQLRAQFEELINGNGSATSEQGTNILQLTLASSTRGFACATITVGCPLPKVTRHGYCIDDTFLGITPLYSADGATVDLIAVPGLGSHALGSFKSSGGFEVWLRDFLPRDIPSIRVLLYGYDTTLAGNESKSSIHDLSKSFLESVRAFRVGTQTRRRPMIFIGHSLGILLIKEALALANKDRKDSKTIDFSLSSCGLVFFDVPNLGLRQLQLQTMVAGQPNAQLVQDLVVDEDFEPSPYLRDLSRSFIECSKDQNPTYNILSYYERRLSPTVKVSPLSLLSGYQVFWFVLKHPSAFELRELARHKYAYPL